MERRGSTPPGALRPEELVALVGAPGPVLSLYLPTERATDNAAYRLAQRWKRTRAYLSQDSVPEAVLAAVDPLIFDAHLNGDCLAVVAGEDAVRLVEHGPEHPVCDVVSWSPLPHVIPLLAWLQRAPTHIVVLVDRIGADFVTVVGGHPDAQSGAGGATEPLTKVAVGGWSQRRYQQRAENTWEQNATAVARELESLVKAYDARLVVVAGDIRARQLLRDNLPSEILERLEEVAGSRAVDGSESLTIAEIASALDRAVEHDTRTLVAKFAEEQGQQDRAASGVADTLHALRSAQVEVLLLVEDFDRERRAWFGPDAPEQVALRADQLRALGVDDPREAPLVDVLVRAALGTGAAIRLVPPASSPADGVGVILRWSG